ncbi:MAG TPA: pilus assembly protein TadG-related protein, partial [Vitreimonas sp.]|nr:pilus assembly protein TadG-related protein [Vitreimonas sp.]
MSGAGRRPPGRRSLSAHGRREPRGQVLVIFALSITALLAFAGLAFDVGRFYSERRFLQNSADAGALAAANALIRGESDSAAEDSARAVLARNFLGSPSGVVPAMPPATPQYEPGHAGDPRYLSHGILINGGDVRVAVRNIVDYTFGRAVGLGANDLGARARVNLAGNLMPIAVRRYINAPGPNSGATAPCPDNHSQFMDFFATANTACLGSETNAALRSAPNHGSPFNPSNPNDDPGNHGPIVAILGQGSQPASSSDFRGFVVLDIRNFSSSASQLYYNGVTAGTNANTLKAMEAGWISKGYPGPGFPPVVSPPDPNLQVAVMSGNSTGIAVDAVAQRFAPGDPLLVAVYPGIVNAIPDFSLGQITAIAVPETGTVANAGSFKVSRNQSFSGQVTLSTLADTTDPTNPMVVGTLLGGAAPITYTPNPVSPATGSGTTVNMS